MAPDIRLAIRNASDGRSSATCRSEPAPASRCPCGGRRPRPTPPVPGSPRQCTRAASWPASTQSLGQRHVWPNIAKRAKRQHQYAHRDQFIGEPLVLDDINRRPGFPALLTAILRRTATLALRCAGKPGRRSVDLCWYGDPVDRNGRKSSPSRPAEPAVASGVHPFPAPVPGYRGGLGGAADRRHRSCPAVGQFALVGELRQLWSTEAGIRSAPPSWCWTCVTGWTTG